MEKSKIKIPTQFKGKDVTVRRPLMRAHAAVINVDGVQFYLPQEFAGDYLHVAQESSGELYGIADMDGNDITAVRKLEYLPASHVKMNRKVV